MSVDHMSLVDSLLVSVLGMGIVFAVLIILNGMIKGLSVLVGIMKKEPGA